MNSEANIGFIVESVVNETSRLCQCQLTAEQIQDAMLTCSNDSNAVTFRASLVGSEANTSTAVLEKMEEWVMNPSSSITIQGRRLSLNPNCDIHLSSFTEDSCIPTSIPLPSPTPTTMVSTPGPESNIAAIVVPIVIVLLLIFILLLILICCLVIVCQRRGKGSYTVFK